MGNDQTFRTVLIVGALTVFPIMAYHRLRSQATGERLDRWQEGRFILFTLRPVGVAAMLGLLAFMIDPSWMAWSSARLPAWLRWTGVGFGVLAGGLLIWTLPSLGKNLTDTVVTRKDHRLVTTGPYRWVRHPFYDAVGLAVLANSLTAANWFLFLTGGLAFILMIVRTRTEEEHLLARFGDSYRAYVERTGRFLPRVRGQDVAPNPGYLSYLSAMPRSVLRSLGVGLLAGIAGALFAATAANLLGVPATIAATAAGLAGVLIVGSVHYHSPPNDPGGGTPGA